nr:family 43 glycosylhydrolase [Saccharophagus degradans]
MEVKVKKIEKIVKHTARTIALGATGAALLTGLIACNGTNVNTNGDTQQASIKKAPEGMFANPLFANGADPWLEYYDGNYYLTTTTWTSQLVMRKSPTLDGLSTALPVNVWSDSDLTRCCNFWAFEFHRLNGPNGWRWYLMYTSGQHGTLDHQHLSVLESVGDDPMGPYTYKGEMMPNTWNIDGSYLEHNGQLYLLWSEWVGDEQQNFISKMTTPWSIEGPRALLTRPEEEWEKSGRKVNEGPEILKKDGRTFLIYSASYCDTPDYKLAMKELMGDDPMNPEHWTKYDKPVFERGNGVFAPGHNGFFKSPDGTEDWIVYHGNSKEEHGCGATRSVRAQKFTWNTDGTPNFGEPIPEGQLLPLPSGENGPLVTALQGARIQLRNGENCLLAEGKEVKQGNCQAETSLWVMDNTADNYYRFGNVASNLFLTANEGLSQSAWVNTASQRWALNAGEGNFVSLTNKYTGDALMRNNWQILPVGKVAISSIQSGRVLQACDKNNANVNQGGWQGKACQAWQFNPASEGHVQIKTGNQCLTVENKSIVPGTNVIAGECESTSSQWLYQLDKEGRATFTNRESKQRLDLANCGLAEGTNFAQAPALDTICQAFQVRYLP